MTAENPDMPVLEKGTYVHSKTGNRYEVLGVAMHSETHEPLVVYTPLYTTKYELFARPYDMFVETVSVDGVHAPRFVKADAL